MTISRKLNPNATVRTILNLATSKRALMLLYNPLEIEREFWQVHLHVFGLSMVYFERDTEATGGRRLIIGQHEAQTLAAIAQSKSVAVAMAVVAGYIAGKIRS